MFKIARADYTQRFDPAFSPAETSDILAQFCLCEAWSGDLSDGLFHLGPQAMKLHGLDSSDCGLINLLRAYDEADRTRIVGLFEQAATASSSFCFSTTIRRATGVQRPVFCIGESSGLEHQYSGDLRGMFFFPHFQLDNGRSPVFNQ